MQERWSKELKEKIITNLISGNYQDLPKTNENLVDLRGLNLECNKEAIEIRNVDLSYSILNGEISLQNCKFDFSENKNTAFFNRISNSKGLGIKIYSLRSSSSGFEIIDSDFSYSRFNEFLYSENKKFFIKQTKFYGCNFSKTKFGRRLTFEKCDFRNVNFNNSELGFLNFIDCDFTGASFDNVYYKITNFISCIGLNRSKMERHLPQNFGIQLADKQDIIIK